MDNKNNFGHQDWNQIVLTNESNKKQKSHEIKNKPNDNLAHAYKLENDSENFKNKRVTSSVRNQIIKARASKKMTQKELATRSNLQSTIISDIESGRAIYNPQHIRKIGRVLGINIIIK